MKKLVRLTESELEGIVSKSVARIFNDSIEKAKEVELAQSELFSMGKGLSSIGFRLQGTPYEALYDRIREAFVRLNDALLKDKIANL